MRLDWRVALLWACAAARLLFYASMLPLWEGFDEWAHFAVIRATSHGSVLPARDIRIPLDVEASLGIVPMPWLERTLPPPTVTHDAFWQLPPEQRQARAAAFAAIPRSFADQPGTLPAYETQQPPLYYWSMAPVAFLLRGAPLADQVLVLRWLSALLASLAIPLVFAIGRAVFDDDALALAGAAVVALMPGFAIDVARVGNDGLAVVFFSAVIWLGFHPRHRALWLGVAVGLGLLTKAYVLTVIPAVALLLVLRRARWFAAAAAALAVGGWWYVRNLLTHGSLTGLTESAMPASGAVMWRHVFDINWPKAIDSALFAHIYTGGWSMLTVRSWIYHLFYVAAAIAAIGLIRVRRDRRIWWLAAVYACYWIGACYDILLLYVTRGVATSMGYYLYAVVAAEIPLALAAFRRWAAAVFALLFGALDLYTVHAVDIPYYTGLIRHTGGNAIAAVHWRDFEAIGFIELFRRLAIFKDAYGSSALLVALWIAYLVSTLTLVAIALHAVRKSQHVKF